MLRTASPHCCAVRTTFPLAQSLFHVLGGVVAKHVAGTPMKNVGIGTHHVPWNTFMNRKNGVRVASTWVQPFMPKAETSDDQGLVRGPRPWAFGAALHAEGGDLMPTRILGYVAMFLLVALVAGVILGTRGLAEEVAPGVKPPECVTLSVPPSAAFPPLMLSTS